MNPFIHLRAQSTYSLGGSALKISSIIELCKKFKMPAVGVTDDNNLFGAFEFSLECAKKWVQPIVGSLVTLRYQDPHIHNKVFYEKIPLLVQNKTGYLNLLKLMTLLYCRDYFGIENKKSINSNLEESITLEELSDHSEGLIALIGGAQSYAYENFRDNKNDLAASLLADLHKIFKDRTYVEIMRYQGSDDIKDPLACEIEKKLLEWAYAKNVPIVATNQALFATQDDYEAHDVLLCIANSTYVEVEDRPKVSPYHYFKSQEEMRELFKDLPEAIENTSVIAKRCAYMLTEIKPIFPPFDVPEGVSEAEHLRSEANLGLHKRLIYVDPSLYPTYQARLDYELDMIERMGFPGYFLVVADFIKWAKSHDIPVGPGRGSGAGSLVAWSLTITDVDPIRFGLIFERFLNPERVSMPDFDIDFCQDRRDEVVNYVIEKYGKERVAQIITFGKLQARAVIRDVGRVLQMPYGQIDKICTLIPNNPNSPVTLSQAVEEDQQIKDMRDDDPKVAKLIEISLKLEGLYRHASTHAAGVIIADRSIDNLSPLYKDPKSHMPATQFNMKYVEMAGLMKFDFLGLKTLTMLALTVKLIKKVRSIDIDLGLIPLEDNKSFELLNRLETIGVFQLEGAGMREAIRTTKPDRFEDIIALVALFRPGPMDDIPKYSARKHGREIIEYPHPMLEDILKETYGVMVYQEQVMHIAQVMAGYSLGQADLLRRAMGKKIKAEMDAQREQFVSGATNKGVDKQQADAIFDLMSKFAGYGFNKSHSAPYGLLAYQCAYLKSNFSEEFMAATMTLDMGNTDKINIYVQELKRMGIPLLSPSINHSELGFKVETLEDGSRAIRYALGALKGAGEGIVNTVVKVREEGGAFKSLGDMIKRVPAKVLNKGFVELLACSGALDCFGVKRKVLYDNVSKMLKKEDEDDSNQGVLFKIEPDYSWTQSKEEWSFVEKLNKEQSVIGFYLNDHPIKPYVELLRKNGFNNLSTMNTVQSFRVAGIINDIKKHRTKAGKHMAFVQLSDHTGVNEIVCFDDVWYRSQEVMQIGNMVVVEGKVVSKGEGIRINVDDIYNLEKALEASFKNITIKIKNEHELLHLKDIMNGLIEDQKLEQTKTGEIICELHLNPENEAIKFVIPFPQNIGFKLWPELNNFYM